MKKTMVDNILNETEPGTVQMQRRNYIPLDRDVKSVKVVHLF
jgi:hypothetical protein